MAPQIRKLHILISAKGLEAVGSNPFQCENWAVKGVAIQSKDGVFHAAVQFCTNFVLTFDTSVHQKQLSRASSEFWRSQVCSIAFLICALLF